MRRIREGRKSVTRNPIRKSSRSALAYRTEPSPAAIEEGTRSAIHQSERRARKYLACQMVRYRGSIVNYFRLCHVFVRYCNSTKTNAMQKSGTGGWKYYNKDSEWVSVDGIITGRQSIGWPSQVNVNGDFHNKNKNIKWLSIVIVVWSRIILIMTKRGDYCFRGHREKEGGMVGESGAINQRRMHL